MVNCYPVLTLTGPVTTAGVYLWTASNALPSQFRPPTGINSFGVGSNNGSIVQVSVGIDTTGIFSCNIFPNVAWAGGILVYQWNMTWSV